MLERLKITAEKALQSLVSVKVGSVALFTALLCFKHIDQYVYAALTSATLGLREFTKLKLSSKVKK
jgi:hypothetical protein